MIVDLLRNDLSRVCAPHSVEVPALCHLVSYASVHHLVSIVASDLAGDKSSLPYFEDDFPAAPVRVCQRCDENYYGNRQCVPLTKNSKDHR